MSKSQNTQNAKTAQNPEIESFLNTLDAEKRAEIDAARAFVAQHLATKYEEVFQYGMISWVIPLEVTGKTYNGQPLSVVSLGVKKSVYSLHLISMYIFPESRIILERESQQLGYKLDIGKGCLRFRKFSDLPAEPLAELLKKIDYNGLITAMVKQGKSSHH